MHEKKENGGFIIKMYTQSGTKHMLIQIKSPSPVDWKICFYARLYNFLNN